MQGFRSVSRLHTQGCSRLLSGTIRATIGEQSEEAAAGDAILVPAGSRFGVDNLTDELAIAWVTTSAGFMGILPDGSWITPPWTR
jgi:hypothetical protein